MLIACAALMLFWGVLASGCRQREEIPEVARWTLFEKEFLSSAGFDHPAHDLEVIVSLGAPSGKEYAVAAFWDGNRRWKFRFSPDEIGIWTWRATSVPAVPDIHGRQGRFNAVPYTGSNPVYRRGALRLSENRLYLTDAAGTPFFWLADTVWNGALLSQEDEWSRFLEDRRSKEFSVIQFVCTQWRAAPSDELGQTAYSGRERIELNPAFFQRLDRRIQAINESGLVAAPVLLWALPGPRPGWSPGVDLPEDQAVFLARYLVARYGGHRVIWILGGDGDYGEERAERWIRIGRKVFGTERLGPDRLVTLHPMGQNWVAEEFRHESWFRFNSYQSGHGDSDAALLWLLQGPPATQWKNAPLLPSLNLEPNYEGHKGYTHQTVFGDYAVRRAAYWSLLVAPPAGVSYGAHGVWSWNRITGPPLNHASTGDAPPWSDAMRLPGSTDMQRLSRLFASLEWWRLRPAPELLETQPGREDPHRFVTVARTENGNWALLYLPDETAVTLKTDLLNQPNQSRWYNPRSGQWEPEVELKAGSRIFTPPAPGDWVLWVGKR